MGVKLAAASGGSVELVPTNTASNYTITMPASTGTVLTTTSPKVGNVLQVVNATVTAEASNSTSTFADTGLTATITPTSATSKILVLVNHCGCAKTNSNTGLQIKLLRNGSQIVYLEDAGCYTNSTASNFVGSVSCSYLDSPATTSAVTYKTQLASRGNNAIVYVQTYGSVLATSTITLMEIAA